MIDVGFLKALTLTLSNGKEKGTEPTCRLRRLPP